MAKRKVAQRATCPLSIWSKEYFDATFTSDERYAIRVKLMNSCGYTYRNAGTLTGRLDFVGFEHDIERPAEDAIWPAFCAHGLTYESDRDRLSDYALIHICRELQIDYKSFAKNAPKLPIHGFIKAAKHAFPEFRCPRNSIERKIQERKLHMLWCEWLEEESARTGCGRWESDRFVKRDYAAILEEIVAYNAKRPKLLASNEPTISEARPKRQKPVLRIAVNNT